MFCGKENKRLKPPVLESAGIFLIVMYPFTRTARRRPFRRGGVGEARKIDGRQREMESENYCVPDFICRAAGIKPVLTCPTDGAESLYGENGVKEKEETGNKYPDLKDGENSFRRLRKNAKNPPQTRGDAFPRSVKFKN